MVKLYTPIPMRYAVVHMDPIASVEGFSYTDILQAAKEMTPKRYLVFIRVDVGFAWPHEPWFLFDVIPIAPCVPPDDGTMTPEMCVPIFPNTSHPSGRTHIKTNPPFPYDNCYHWSHARQLTVRVRAKPEKFDDGHATKLEPRELITFWELIAPDRTCGEPLEEDRSRASGSFCSGATTRIGNVSRPDEHLRHTTSEDDIRDGSATSETHSSASQDLANGESERVMESAASASSHSPQSADSEHSATAEFRAIVRTGIFGNPNEDKEIYPLVDLWLELADNLKQDDIPHPEDFYKEYDTVVGLVAEAKRRHEQEERFKALTQQVGEQGDLSDAYSEQTDLGKKVLMTRKKNKGCRPQKVIGKLRARAARTFIRFKHCLRLPYVPVWP